MGCIHADGGSPNSTCRRCEQEQEPQRCERAGCNRRATHDVATNGKSVACCHDCATTLAALVASAGSHVSITRRPTSEEERHG